MKTLSAPVVSFIATIHTGGIECFVADVVGNGETHYTRGAYGDEVGAVARLLGRLGVEVATVTFVEVKADHIARRAETVRGVPNALGEFGSAVAS